MNRLYDAAMLPEALCNFVAEASDVIYMLEPKARNEMDSADVLAKQAVAIQWCAHASEHAGSFSGKPWQYALIPHDIIAENMTLSGIVAHSSGR